MLCNLFWSLYGIHNHWKSVHYTLYSWDRRGGVNTVQFEESWQTVQIWAVYTAKVGDSLYCTVYIYMWEYILCSVQVGRGLKTVQCIQAGLHILNWNCAKYLQRTVSSVQCT